MFINCPFSPDYKFLFNGILFAILYCEHLPRCALEIRDSSENRLDKIIRIIDESALGVHDISFTAIDKTTRLPRFNMPFELGLFMGAKHYGAAEKSALILDKKSFRYRRFLSDISGMDVEAHDGDVKTAIGHVRNWLGARLKGRVIPGGDHIHDAYGDFLSRLPEVCRRLKIHIDNIEYADLCNMMQEFMSRET